MSTGKRAAELLNVYRHPAYVALRGAQQATRERILAPLIRNSRTADTIAYREADRRLRRVVGRLITGGVITGSRVKTQITVYLHRETRSLRAVEKRIKRRRTLVNLLFAARDHVAICRGCDSWFGRNTTKQRYCTARCSARHRAGKRRGSKPRSYSVVPNNEPIPIYIPGLLRRHVLKDIVLVPKRDRD